MAQAPTAAWQATSCTPETPRCERPLQVLYLTSDLDDPATWRRVAMLEAGGAELRLAGFRRAATPSPGPALVLGRTHPGQFLRRTGSALRPLLGGDLQQRGWWPGWWPDVILARNLEILPLAQRLRAATDGRAPPRLVYEVLDIHRLLVGGGLAARLLRRIERGLCRRLDGVIVSSARFESAHFLRHRQTTAPVWLVENKFWDPSAPVAAPPRLQRQGGDPPLVIGWFGVLRCAASLGCLDRLSRLAGGRIRVVLRGRPARDALPDLDRVLAANPHITFHGAYAYPDDLARIYGAIDIAWLVDRFDAGANSDWLLPNRLYESCLHGAVPLALAGTETGRFLTQRGLGLVLQGLEPCRLRDRLLALDAATLEAMRRQVAAHGPAAWRATQQDCQRLVDLLAGRSAPLTPRSANTEERGLSALEAVG